MKTDINSWQPENDGIPKYSRIKEIILRKIEQEKYPPNTKLPTVRDLIRDYDVSDITARRVLRELINDGIAYTIPGKGSYLSEKTSRVNNIPPPQENKRIIFIAIDTRSGFYSYILTGILNITQSCGYSLEIYNSEQEYSTETKLLSKFVKEPIAGLIFSPAFRDKRYVNLLSLKEKHVPVVLLDRNIDCYENDFDYISSNNIKGAREAVDYLVGCGHRRILCLGMNINISTIHDRVKGYKKSLKSKKIKIDNNLIVFGKGSDFSKEETELKSEINKLLSRNIKFTAVFAMNDITAIRVYKILKEKRIKVPEDVSIIGFNDEPIAEYFEVPLTTVRQNTYHLGYYAAKMLLQKIENHRLDTSEEVSTERKLIKTKLIIRKSVKKLKP